MAHTIVIFGASGDLTSRKLIPALYELYRKKRLPQKTRVVGFSRTPSSATRPGGSRLAGEHGDFVGEQFDGRCGESSPSRSSISPATSATPTISLRWPSFLSSMEGPAGATRVYYLSTAPQLVRRR